ncbi:MAG: hypothetical protein ACFE9L_08715 [Candidatus Hodarchaeota archaeon]
MTKFSFKSYQKGFEIEQARIGIEVAKNWAWPHAYSLDDLKNKYSGDFDPETVQFCILGNQIIGYTFFEISLPDENGVTQAWLDYPRLLSGYEEAVPLLIEKAIEVMKKKGVNFIRTRVTTMWENSFEIIERSGFLEQEKYKRGAKVYYIYNLANGTINISDLPVSECTTEEEFKKCSELATYWYNEPKDWAKTHLKEKFPPEDTIAHLYVQDDNKVQAACIVAPNELNKSIAAFYYIYSPNERYLEPLVEKAISSCIEKGYKKLLVDLIRKHRGYEDFYSRIGFRKAAEWGYYEKKL